MEPGSCRCAGCTFPLPHRPPLFLKLELLLILRSERSWIFSVRCTSSVVDIVLLHVARCLYTDVNSVLLPRSRILNHKIPSLSQAADRLPDDDQGDRPTVRANPEKPAPIANIFNVHSPPARPRITGDAFNYLPHIISLNYKKITKLFALARHKRSPSSPAFDLFISGYPGRNYSRSADGPRRQWRLRQSSSAAKRTARGTRRECDCSRARGKEPFIKGIQVAGSTPRRQTACPRLAGSSSHTRTRVKEFDIETEERFPARYCTDDDCAPGLTKRRGAFRHIY